MRSGCLRFLDVLSSNRGSSCGSCLMLCLHTSPFLQEHSDAAVEGDELGVVEPEDGADDTALLGEKAQLAPLSAIIGELRDMKRRNSE